jgi:hypothetical protein
MSKIDIEAGKGWDRRSRPPSAELSGPAGLARRKRRRLGMKLIALSGTGTSTIFPTPPRIEICAARHIFSRANGMQSDRGIFT